MFSLGALEEITFDINSSRSKVYGYKSHHYHDAARALSWEEEDPLSKFPSFITYKFDSAANQ